VKPPSPPSAQSIQTKKKPPGDLAISPFNARSALDTASGSIHFQQSLGDTSRHAVQKTTFFDDR
jgi:hypothetical protein